MFRFLFRTLFRALRVTFRLGLLAGIGFALFKLVQGRRESSPVGSAAEWTARPRRPETGRPTSETPLVDPHMLRGVSLRREEYGSAEPAPVAGAPEAGGAEPAVDPEPAPVPEKPAPVSKKAAAKKASPKNASGPMTARIWVDPEGGICPTSHPVKGKLSSGIYHLPGMVAYDRTMPDRCYRDADAAEAEGLRKAKR